MKILFCFILLCSYNACLSQQISVSDLIKLLKTNENDNELFLNEKGFVLDRLDTEESHSTTWYALNKNTESNTAKIWVAIATFNDHTKSLVS